MRGITLGAWIAAACLVIAASGCFEEGSHPEGLVEGTRDKGPVFEAGDEIIPLGRPVPGAERRAYFGDLHVHTTYSFDAFVFGTVATPYDAYRYALGDPIMHPGGFEVQLRQPLDFYAVTDHAAFLGAAKEAADPESDFGKLEIAENLHHMNDPGNVGLLSLGKRLRTFSRFLPAAVTGVRDGSVDREVVLDIARRAWRDTVDAAELFNDPGRFTTFIAYEYTSSTDDRGNLHRNVIFEGGDEIPAVPFSRFHSQNPEGLWDWMDGLRARGIESLAIPHNSNGSNGQMFKLVDWAGDPMDDAYAERRIRNEPLVEITQVKGTSETHPALSTTDEWADFEIMSVRVATMMPSEPAGSYVRDALKRGLVMESRGVANPYKFGFVGASDTHTGAISDDESNYFAKIGLLDSTPELRGSVPLPWYLSLAARLAFPKMVKEIDGRKFVESASPTYSASGLTGVWAEENTRESIYSAFRRKETFATSGPRIRVRLFGGYGLEAGLLDAPGGVMNAYVNGVAMGEDLPRSPGQEPRFLVWALADPQSAPLQRLQIVKGWVEGGEAYEKVYDVACSGDAPVDPATDRCPDNGARVDLSDCSISADVGAGDLRAFWRDADFDPSQHAFYYARVLENPTCRWSTWDALRAGVEPRPDLAKTIQERAWSSPITYEPTSPGIESAASTVE